MILGIVLIIVGIAIAIYVRKSFMTEYNSSKLFAKYFKSWQGIILGIAIIIIGIAQIISSQ